MIRLALAALALLAACSARDPVRPGALPPDPALYAAVPSGHTAWSNASLARLFVTLTHETEWGGEQRYLVRLEPPVTVAMEGRIAPQYRRFVGDYLGFLRREAGLAIGLGVTDPNLFLRFVPGAEFEAALPAAACVVAPGNLRWDRFRKAPDKLGGMAMLEVRSIEAVTVFIPDAAIPADIRRCLIEEIAQSLGPRNDLYGLGPSIFNDDFGHLWPTRLDLLMLRLLYAPGMEGGLSRRETEARARAVLARINPSGHSAPPLPDPKSALPSGWRRQIAQTATRAGSGASRQAAAEQALALARAAPRGPALCHSLATLGALARLETPNRAARLLAEATEVCTAQHGPDDPRVLTLALSRAGLALKRGDPKTALALSDPLPRRLAAHGLDEALASVYAIRRRALDALGRTAEADAATAQARAWSAYAFGISRTP
ncbi:MAG: DUF2927 domain-containing protein [Pseudomonadota bacterium]